MNKKTTKKRLTDATIAEREDEIDASEGMAALADDEGTTPLEEYLEKRGGGESIGHKNLGASPPSSLRSSE